MEVKVTRLAPDAFLLRLAETEAILDSRDLQTLMEQIAEIMPPGSEVQRATLGERYRAFVARLKTANGLGIQGLLRAADRDDILVLLKAGEQDDVLRGKFYVNMTARARKMLDEDLRYRFREGISQAAVEEALRRLAQIVQRLESEGILEFEPEG
jgi:hypothetical protein